MAATVAVLEIDQHAKVAAAVTAGKTISYALNPCPGNGQVWPHVLGDGKPVCFLSPKQVQLMLQSLKDGKTLGVSTHGASNRQQIDAS